MKNTKMIKMSTLNLVVMEIVMVAVVGLREEMGGKRK